ncbi:facilitated trehalose transporter Tret1-like, partial [Sitodiplosis mosellana]|uniref:facilitated trehalose transporter Tret1-like n=1 Tax=Sitodiplosis mosellana TaxID=263140 RepID=UPI002443F144
MDIAKDTMAQFQWTNIWHQYYATFVGNLIMLGHGLIVGSLAPALSILSSKNTPLASGVPLNNEEVSWIGSINCLGGLCGSILFGYAASVIGCKRSLFFVSFTTATFWVLTYFGTVYSEIFVARFISGLSGGGIQAVSILFISEISNDDIRGRLGSVTLVMRNIGILIAYILGATINYFQMPIVCVSVPIIFMILFLMLPNTPQYFLQRGQTKASDD